MAKRVTIGGEILDAFTRDLVNALATLGWRASIEAYKRKSFTNRTFNLHDSYGSAVYVNGVLQDRTIRYMGGQMSHRYGTSQQAPKRKRKSKLGPRYYRYGKSGREVLDVFFHGNKWYKGRQFGKKGIVLVVVAAMWYADFLEKKGYKVITDVGNAYIAQHIDEVITPICKKYGVPKKLVRSSVIARADEDWFGEDFKYKHEI